ncbi:unnamed protein product [Didymodactylos carnosus]|uniref:VOC domain-containing protein n=1 Tax=Didymodactylos carnosus TaxID=1234261 RepID=A0A814AVV9_9BILA|nr:unnamed protein product [Didymodactylos carnosus]CAF3698804.1 unnamed protein product [Didymodactylos carnosus]
MASQSLSSQSSSEERRLLHYTLKIMDRDAAKKFFCDVLGMHMLRHEEMDSGCKAKCNGDFESPWSKTMVGYGNEDLNFAFELNYNYEVKGYEMGNDFHSLTIKSKQAVANAKSILNANSIQKYGNNNEGYIVNSPDGHKVILLNEDVDRDDDPVVRLSLNVSNLDRSINYYTNFLKMKTVDKTNDRVLLYYGYEKLANTPTNEKTAAGFKLTNQCKLELVDIHKPIHRGTGYGRIAFSCPTDDIPKIEEMMKDNKQGSIIIPEMKLGGLLDTKVTVVILGDPDEHEICFVGEENYIKACKTDDGASKKFAKALADTSEYPIDERHYDIGEDEKTKKQENDK